MMSTGEVGCIGEGVYEALLLCLLSTGFKVPRRGVLLSLGPKVEKFGFADEALIIRDELQLPMFATAGTAEMLADSTCRATRWARSQNDAGERRARHRPAGWSIWSSISRARMTRRAGPTATRFAARPSTRACR